MSKSRYTATTVDYATSDGTATAGPDYTATSGRLTFAAGEISKTVPVTVHDDSHDEGSETMVLTLSNPSGAVLGDASATGTIAAVGVDAERDGCMRHLFGSTALFESGKAKDPISTFRD